MGRTPFLAPSKTNEAYFVRGNKYARIKFVPGSTEEQITYGPATFVDRWPLLASVGFHTIDAVLPVPETEGQVFVFSGFKYVRYKLIPSSNDEKIFSGPHHITEKWASLKDAGFYTVDAVLPVPNNPQEAYFNGNKYVRIRVVDSSRTDKLIYGPSVITEKWKSLEQVGFTTIDAALLVPGHEGQAYFFSGSLYCKIRFSLGDEEVRVGPKPIYQEWKTLNWGW
ncbi:Hemopexin-like domain-containing protein [Cladorrhinum sp. PSN259]|nr:Hemopexin-like domain-containing protein [Cladorrhinum sp. PSN259]